MDIKPINAFYDLPDPNQGQQMPPIYGNGGILDNVNALNVGNGANGFYVDRDGLRLGNSAAAAAPFAVDMNGNIKAISLILYNAGVPQIVLGTF